MLRAWMLVIAFAVGGGSAHSPPVLVSFSIYEGPSVGRAFS